MTLGWSPSDQYRKVAEANRLLYADTAWQYETTEEGTVPEREHRMIDADLEAILRDMGYPDRGITALDACGGTGKIALKLAAMNGIDVTICDISPGLLDIFQQKCDQMGYKCHVVCEEIGNFLASNEKRFDLTVFAAALHHLEDIPSVLELAARSLSERGRIYAVLDLTTRPRVANVLLLLDYMVFKARHQPHTFFAGLARRLSRLVNARREGALAKEAMDLLPENIGILAEYHADRGIDDLWLAGELRRRGLDLVWHVRYPNARYFPFRVLLKLLGCPTAFKLLLKKAAVEGCYPPDGRLAYAASHQSA